MKKYLFTESQIKKVVDLIVNEEYGRHEYGRHGFHRDVLGIKDLAEIISRMGQDYEITLQIFQDAFRNGGDEEVKMLFKAGTDMDLEDVGKGRYVIKY